MQIPNLPTDNLYKFFALAGVVIIITCLIIPTYLIRNIKYEIVETETEMGEIDYKIKGLKKRRLEIEANIMIVDSLLNLSNFSDSIHQDINFADHIKRIYDPEYREFIKFI